MTDTDSLKHYGVLGMKWGKRRGASSSKSSKSKTPDSDDHVNKTKIKKKKVSQMSNDELKKLTTRLQLEKQLKDLSKSDRNVGARVAEDILKTSGKQAMGQLVGMGVKAGVKLIIDTAKK